MGYMKWCCFWNTVYDGTIASGVHMLLSTFVYLGMCFALFSFGSYYGSEQSIPMAAAHRQHRFQQQRSYYQSLSVMTGDANNDHANNAQMEEFRRPLLTHAERDLYVYSALVMMGINVPIIFTSILLILGAVLRKPRIMFLWVISMVPYLIIDTVYHSFLFYTLLDFTDLDALQAFLWFQLWTVMIIMFWVFRCAFDVYAILCVMALRNEILRSGKSKLKSITAENGSPAGGASSKKHDEGGLPGGSPEKPKGAALAAIAKSGLQPTASLFSTSFASSLEEDVAHKQQLDALHNAAASGDIQHQLLLMSAAQHLAAASGLLAPERQPLSSSQQTNNLIDFNSPAATDNNSHHHHPPGLMSQISVTSLSAGPQQAGDPAGASSLLLPPASSGTPGGGGAGGAGAPPTTPMTPKRPVTGWGMSKYLLKQQQQALAIASGLHKSGFLPPNAPLTAVAQAAAAGSFLTVPGAAHSAKSAKQNGQALGNSPHQQQQPTQIILSSQSKRYAKHWLKMNQASGDEDFSSQQMIDAA